MEKDLQATLDMAIKKEIEAYEFYMDLSGMVKDEETKKTIEYLASEERRHREFLEDYRDKGQGQEGLRMADVVDYRIAQELEAPDMKKLAESKDPYLIAAQRELHFYNFYCALADIHPAGKVREVLLKTANEELKHKEKMEWNTSMQTLLTPRQQEDNCHSSLLLRTVLSCPPLLKKINSRDGHIFHAVRCKELDDPHC